MGLRSHEIMRTLSLGVSHFAPSGMSIDWNASAKNRRVLAETLRSLPYRRSHLEQVRAVKGDRVIAGADPIEKQPRNCSLLLLYCHFRSEKRNGGRCSQYEVFTLGRGAGALCPGVDLVSGLSGCRVRFGEKRRPPQTRVRSRFFATRRLGVLGG